MSNFKAKIHQIRSRLGLRPRPVGGAYSAPLLCSGVVPLRHLRHVPAPLDGVATLVNSLQNRVKSITLCVILNAKNGKQSL